MIAGGRPRPVPRGRGAHTRGVADWARASERLLGKLERATVRGIDDGLGMIERAEKRNLRRRTHPLGTPTTSPPGEPPALVTGHMRASWRMRNAHQVGAHRFRGYGGNTSVQARIQELGGRAGRGHRAKLPPRPYLEPAVRGSAREIHEGFRRRYSTVILSTI